ncbi:MAG: hypothetical protein M3Q86_07950 [Verrucomicrobiota bacterium]|nr:hypothetical protein [Verrucomicrobiota bacterium]
MRFRYSLPLIACFTIAATGVGPAAETEKPSAAPYRILGVLDPDRDQIVAFALKVPRDWQVQQSFKRQWEGAVAQNRIYLSLRSPDGNSQIEYLPAAAYVFSEGPQSNRLRAQLRARGIPAAPNEVQPMPPVAYIKQMFLSYLAQNNMALSNLGNEQDAPRQRGNDGQIKLRGSVDGTLPNGHQARVECRIDISSQQINGDTYYGWTVIPSITQTSGDLEAIHTYTRVAQDSIVVNPTWQQIENEAQNRGAQANTAAMTRGHEQRMEGIRRFGEANTARFNQRMADMDRNKAAFDARMSSMDRQQEITVDTIRGVSKYSDPSTGERVKIEDGYHHNYRNTQDPTVYYSTNTPIEANQLDWQELKKVELKNY